MLNKPSPHFTLLSTAFLITSAFLMTACSKGGDFGGSSSKTSTLETTDDPNRIKLTIKEIDTPRGPAFGGNTITITGTNFKPSTVMRVGGIPCTRLGFTNSTTFTCVVPAHASGLVDIEAFNIRTPEDRVPSDYQALLKVAYTYTPAELPRGFTSNNSSNETRGGRIVMRANIGAITGGSQSTEVLPENRIRLDSASARQKQ